MTRAENLIEQFRKPDARMKRIAEAFGISTSTATAALAFEESKHPRADDGKFGEGGAKSKESAPGNDSAGKTGETKWINGSSESHIDKGETGKPQSSPAFRYGKTAGELEFHSVNKDYSEAYAEEKGGDKSHVEATNVALKNPLVVNASDRGFADPSYEVPFIKHAKEQGHDGVVFKNGEDKFFVKFNQSAPEPAKADKPASPNEPAAKTGARGKKAPKKLFRGGGDLKDMRDGWIFFAEHPEYAENYGDVKRADVQIKNAVDLSSVAGIGDVKKEDVADALRDHGIDIPLKDFGEGEIHQVLAPVRNQIREQAIKNGYDGLTQNENFDGREARSWVAFHAQQVASSAVSKREEAKDFARRFKHDDPATWGPEFSEAIQLKKEVGYINPDFYWKGAPADFPKKQEFEKYNALREKAIRKRIDAEGGKLATAALAFDESKHPRGQPGNAGEFGPGGGGAKKDAPEPAKADKPASPNESAGKTGAHDALGAHVRDSKSTTPEQRKQLAEDASKSETKRPVLHRVMAEKPNWTSGETIDIGPTSFTGADVPSGKSAGQIGWKSNDEALVIIEKPKRGLDVDYSKIDTGSVSPQGEAETVIAGKYRVKEIRKVPEPGTKPQDGYTVPQYVLEEVTAPEPAKADKPASEPGGKDGDAKARDSKVKAKIDNAIESEREGSGTIELFHGTRMKDVSIHPGKTFADNKDTADNYSDKKTVSGEVDITGLKIATVKSFNRDDANYGAIGDSDDDLAELQARGIDLIKYEDEDPMQRQHTAYRIVSDNAVNRFKSAMKGVDNSTDEEFDLK